MSLSVLFGKRLLSLLLANGFSFVVSAQKFAPEPGKCLVFIGQDLEATGGLDDYANGYADHFDVPAGVTLYTNLSPGNKSYGHYNKGLDGLLNKANWGAGDTWAKIYLDTPKFNNSALAIGLSFVHNEKKVAQGKHDLLIEKLGHWIKSANRPIFLRIGYEFDGWTWNHYKRKPYLKAWKRIHDIFRALEVDNVAFIWQSKGNGSGQKILEAWYPGDDLVDWCGYSYFGKADEEMLHFARRHKKPVFIAEATPTISTETTKTNGKTKETILSNPDQATEAWEQWFVPFFKTINENPDVVKAISYINCNWKSHRMWFENPTFQDVDARLQTSEMISGKWLEETSKDMYLKASEDLYALLGVK